MGKFFSATPKNFAAKSNRGAGIILKPNNVETDQSLREKAYDSKNTTTIYSTQHLPSEQKVKEQKPMMNNMMDKLQKITLLKPKTKRKNIIFDL